MALMRARALRKGCGLSKVRPDCPSLLLSLVLVAATVKPASGMVRQPMQKDENEPTLINGNGHYSSMVRLGSGLR